MRRVSAHVGRKSRRPAASPSHGHHHHSSHGALAGNEASASPLDAGIDGAVEEETLGDADMDSFLHDISFVAVPPSGGKNRAEGRKGRKGTFIHHVTGKLDEFTYVRAYQ